MKPSEYILDTLRTSPIKESEVPLLVTAAKCKVEPWCETCDTDDCGCLDCEIEHNDH